MFSVISVYPTPALVPALSDIGHILSDENTTDDTVGILLFEQRHLGAISLVNKPNLTDLGIIQFAQYFASVKDIELINIPHLTTRGLQAILARLAPERSGVLRSFALVACPEIDEQGYSRVFEILADCEYLEYLHLGDLTVETFYLFSRMLHKSKFRRNLKFLKIENVTLPTATRGFRTWDDVVTAVALVPVVLPPLVPPAEAGDEAGDSPQDPQPPEQSAEEEDEEEKEKRLARIQELLATFSGESVQLAPGSLTSVQSVGSLDLRRFGQIKKEVSQVLSEEYRELHEVEITSVLGEISTGFEAIGRRHKMDQVKENEKTRFRARLNEEIRTRMK